MTNSDEPREHAHGSAGSPRQPGPMSVPGLSRRRFLQYTGLGAAAAVTAGCSRGPAPAAVGGSSAASKALPEGWNGTIADVKHVVILMQENRSFDHYFGTLRGVRGFGDKQILTYPNGTNIFQQPDKARSDLGYLLPYKLTDQVDGDLDHSWVGDHEARNGGLWNNWVPAKTEETMGYFTRDEIPFQYAVADAFTICDGYHQAIMAPTSPNRMYFWTGTSSGWTSNPDDYTVDFGPDAGTAEVTTYPELLQKAGISWQVYTNHQVGDSGSYPDYFLGDYGDNPLWFYQQYNTTNSRNGGTGGLAVHGAVTPWQTDAGAPPMSKTHAAYVLSTFIKDVKSSKLPQVSWIVAPAGYCEHPSYTPDYGAHYVNTVLQTLFSNPDLWKTTALFITYDEHDGFFDHRLPPAPDDRHRRVHRGAADRPWDPGPDAHLLTVDSRRLRRLQRLRPHLDAPVPGRLDRGEVSQRHPVAGVRDRRPDHCVRLRAPGLLDPEEHPHARPDLGTDPADRRVDGAPRRGRPEDADPGARHPAAPPDQLPAARRRDREPRYQSGHRCADQYRHGRRLLRRLPR